ncbi:MAG: Cardiolipin synthetase [Candidatus Magasanikbacteria bacterium GW2011_GWC2_41_17]|uniref:Cardiolipin synthetase n=2 Tax=Candidatus Magasanikiibacteriota TaxID=1752731 RepID=A0A0G0ZY79_9BACT|nr:MAG: Cardiolipin synthetase [Candidatus Magasanikbacteria bacterium GW2011_GWC2_41_17]KKS53609.1 MAG: Cardiolipin synthetase [Candidatus Magasanikbacteria bacterium GW2011_GWA2_42_32]
MEPKNQYQFFSTTRSALQAMFDAISAAEKSIYWETYIFEQDTIVWPFIEKLKEKARKGVEIKLIIDALGSFGFEEKIMKDMREVGIEVIYFNPVELSFFWRKARRWLERNHRKILVIDEKVGFIGGVNVEKQSFSWFDLHARVEGAMVRHLLKSFAHSYLAGGGSLEKIKSLFYIPLIKEKYWRILWHKPRENFSSVRSVYLRAIKRARHSLTIVNPYFLPDKVFLQALIEARQRGVKIDLILPKRTDLFFLNYAVRAYWSLFARIGLKVYLVKKMIHAKAMMVDGHWAMIGSSNFDYQSFYRNHETNLIFTDKSMIADLKKIFHNWRKSSLLFRPLTWAKRPIREKFFEWIGKILGPIL